jgi:hypothetical protein
LVARVLKPGGAFSMIEASDPKDWWLRPLYLFHLKVVLPLIERILLRGAQDFAMIGTYSTNFGNAVQLAAMLRDQDLEVAFTKYFFGYAPALPGARPGRSGEASYEGVCRPNQCLDCRGNVRSYAARNQRKALVGSAKPGGDHRHEKAQSLFGHRGHTLPRLRGSSGERRANQEHRPGPWRVGGRIGLDARL